MNKRVKDDLRDFGGVEEIRKVWEMVVEEKDDEGMVKMGDMLLDFYEYVVEKRRELGKRYRDRVKEKGDLLKKYEERFGKLS